jgi:hypothetical protein
MAAALRGPRPGVEDRSSNCDLFSRQLHWGVVSCFTHRQTNSVGSLWEGARPVKAGERRSSRFLA